MNDFQEIEKLWNEFYELPFPQGLVGKEINGIDVTSLDSFTAGCIDTFIDNRGSLDNRRKNILENCRNQLRIITSSLEDDGKVYFEKLLVLADKIIPIKK